MKKFMNQQNSIIPILPSPYYRYTVYNAIYNVHHMYIPYNVAALICFIAPQYTLYIADRSLQITNRQAHAKVRLIASHGDTGLPGLCTCCVKYCVISFDISISMITITIITTIIVTNSDLYPILQNTLGWCDTYHINSKSTFQPPNRSIHHPRLSCHCFTLRRPSDQMSGWCSRHWTSWSDSIPTNFLRRTAIGKERQRLVWEK